MAGEKRASFSDWFPHERRSSHTNINLDIEEDPRALSRYGTPTAELDTPEEKVHNLPLVTLTHDNEAGSFWTDDQKNSIKNSCVVTQDKPPTIAYSFVETNAEVNIRDVYGSESPKSRVGKTEGTLLEVNVNAKTFCEFEKVEESSRIEEHSDPDNKCAEHAQLSSNSNDDGTEPINWEEQSADKKEEDENALDKSPEKDQEVGGKNDAAAQTYFRQGFLKPLQQNAVARRKRHCSEPSEKSNDSLILMMEKRNKIRNKWQRVASWARQQRRQNSTPFGLRGSMHTRQHITRRKLTAPQTQAVIASNNDLEDYLNFMYYVCISTRDADISKPGLQRWAQILQKIWFWMFSFFAIAHSVNLLKYSTIEFVENGKLHDYVHLGFLLICCIIRIYSLMLHAFRNDRLKEMSKSMKTASLASLSVDTTISRRISVSVYFMGGSSLLMAILYSLFENRSFQEWSLEKTFLARAYELSHDLIIWSTTNVTGGFNANSNNGETWGSDSMGVTEFIVSFCGNLEDFVLGDLMLISAVSLFKHLDQCKKDIKSKQTHAVTYPEFRDKWEEYRVLARASETFYETCGTLPTLYHIYNLLQFAAFLRLILVKKTAYFVFIATGINVTKSIATYCVTGRISERNKALRSWVRECGFHSLSRKRQKNRKLYMKAIIVLDEMQDNPTGLGREKLFINKGILTTFFGLGASLFGMLTEYADNADMC